MPLEALQCDLLVIGSGAGGLSAAVTAAKLGLKVILAEKAQVFGGTTAISGGWMWVPRNPLAIAAGINEPIEAPLGYLREDIREGFDQARALVYLKAAPNMVRFFQSAGLQFIDGNGIPDFHGNNPHAAKGGRSVGMAPFDGRRLNRLEPGLRRKLRNPIPETTLAGMGIASGQELKHFMNAQRSFKSLRFVAKRLAINCLHRLVHGQSMRLVNGQALAGGLLYAAVSSGVKCYTQWAAIELTRDTDGVHGAKFATPEGEREVRASRGVVLACGGFPHDLARKQAWLAHAPTGAEHWSAAPKTNTGDGIRLSALAGVALSEDFAHGAADAPVSLVPQADGSFTHFPHLLERAKPGLIAVTRQGERFTNEADSYADFMRSLFAYYRERDEHHPIEAWLIADHAFVRRYGFGAAKPSPVPLSQWLAKGYIQKAHSISALARICSIDPKGLQSTIERYNRMAQTGKDDDFAKGETPYNRVQGDAARNLPNPCMAAIEASSLYALRVVPGSLGTFAGIRTNRHWQAIDANNQPIAGLYACGNDAASIMGGYYPSGGITLGPAMTGGWLAARHAANQAFTE